jgi:hypothetical protein
MLACWVEDPNGDYFRRHLARIKDYLWLGEDGIKMQVGKLNSIIIMVPKRFTSSFHSLIYVINKNMKNSHKLEFMLI